MYTGSIEPSPMQELRFLAVYSNDKYFVESKDNFELQVIDHVCFVDNDRVHLQLNGNIDRF